MRLWQKDEWHGNALLVFWPNSPASESSGAQNTLQRSDLSEESICSGADALVTLQDGNCRERPPRAVAEGRDRARLDLR